MHNILCYYCLLYNFYGVGMSDTLNEGEKHPAAASAFQWIMSLGVEKLFGLKEAFASCAIENNRMAEICLGTLNRILNGDKVSDRYVLGLAWAIHEIKEKTCI